MSELTPKEPKTPEEKRARAHKIRIVVLDMFVPVLAELFLILAVIWPNSIMASLAGIFAGAMLIRFSVTRYQGERGMQVFDKLAMAGGIVLILLAAVRLALMGGDAFLMVPTKRNFFELPGPQEDIDWERHVRPMIRDLMTLLAVAQLVCRINVPQPVGEPPADPMA